MESLLWNIVIRVMLPITVILLLTLTIVMLISVIKINIESWKD